MKEILCPFRLLQGQWVIKYIVIKYSGVYKFLSKDNEVNVKQLLMLRVQSLAQELQTVNKNTFPRSELKRRKILLNVKINITNNFDKRKNFTDLKWFYCSRTNDYALQIGQKIRWSKLQQCNIKRNRKDSRPSTYKT